MKIELDSKKAAFVMTGLEVLREQCDQVWNSNTPEMKVVKKQIDRLMQEIREGYDKETYLFIFHCMKCMLGDKENAILKCRGCGAVLSVD